MPFPILHLPYVVFNEIMKMLSFRNLFLLSLCSKRTHQAVKDYQDKSIKLVLNVFADNGSIQAKLSHRKSEGDLVVSVRGLEGVLPIGWMHEKFPGVLFQEERFGLKRCYCYDIENATKPLLEHISDLFSVPINAVTLGQNLMWILDWVEGRQGPKSYEAIITSRRISDNQFRHLLVDLNPRTLELHARPSDQFQIQNFYKNYDAFTLVEGNWFTIENLLTLDCNKVQFHRPRFTDAQINRFLRYALLGGRTSLVFSGRVDGGDHYRILDGVREVLAPIPGEEPLFTNNADSWKLSGMIDGGDRSLFVTINCTKENDDRLDEFLGRFRQRQRVPWIISLNILEE